MTAGATLIQQLVVLVSTPMLRPSYFR
ncbi:hypothetical protein E2C01_065726 [Portunus trituberculatus]|uniref:Uncharacterized protein n=1 Tax=Portunus trituberculatus TaxID=210409 RepID=A0A5B7HP31_PORTR|nr:hypothetical protein [Portunus trituberculatus]